VDWDNAEGSSNTVPKLSKVQREVLTGTLLGDGCLAHHGRFHRLHIKHKLAHFSLVEFKYEVFRDFVSMPLHRFDQRLRGQSYPCVQFATPTHPEFSEWHSRFYIGRRKIAPLDIADHLTPLGLAVWFMDDGAADYAGATIQTHNFLRDEVECLAGVLDDSFGLAASIRANKGGWILYVKASMMEALQRLIEPHLVEGFEYKLIPRRIRTP
jgi:LAGLIDADG DNA endonuclease family